MFDIGDRARLEFILQMIGNIEIVVKGHGDVKKALEDIEGQSAILLFLVQIGEKLGKIKSPDLLADLPIKAAQSVRNIIVHDYTNVNISLIEEIILLNLPELKEKINTILREEEL